MSTPPLDGPITTTRVKEVTDELAGEMPRGYCRECTLFRPLLSSQRCVECENYHQNALAHL